MSSRLASPVLLTGGSGFIGTAAVRRLIAEGVDVIMLLRSGRVGDALPAQADRLAWPADQRQLRAVVRDTGARSVLHLAAHYAAEHDVDDVLPLVVTNVGLTAALADAAVSSGCVQRIVAAGTVWQNASGPGYEPVSLYAATKQAAQDVLEHFRVNAGLAVTTVKMPDTYGPGDRRCKALDILLSAARSGDRLDMSPGEQLLDLVHVDDVVEALVHALRAPAAEPAVALSSGRPLSLRELAALVARVTGRPIHVNWGARPYRVREAMKPWDAGPPLGGWRPKVTLEDGVRRLWAVA